MSLTIIIIVITAITSFMCFNNESLMNKLKHLPYAEHRNKEYYRWITSALVHGDIMHLFLNMFVFHSFGTYVESLYKHQLGQSTGGIVFVIIYFLIVAIANSFTYAKHKDWHGYSAVGASGGVAGILFIFIMSKPWSMLGIMGIIPVPAIIFGGLYLAYESYAAKNIQDNIGHDAHFNGAIAGVCLAIMSIKGVTSNFIYELLNNGPWN